MKFLVLCVVAFFAPQLLDDPAPPAGGPELDRRPSFQTEQAPLADLEDPEYDAEMGKRRRADPRDHKIRGKLNAWLQKRRQTREERITERRERRHRRRVDVDQAEERRHRPPGDRRRIRTLRRAQDPVCRDPLCTLAR